MAKDCNQNTLTTEERQVLTIVWLIHHRKSQNEPMDSSLLTRVIECLKKGQNFQLTFGVGNSKTVDGYFISDQNNQRFFVPKHNMGEALQKYMNGNKNIKLNAGCFLEENESVGLDSEYCPKQPALKFMIRLCPDSEAVATLQQTSDGNTKQEVSRTLVVFVVMFACILPYPITALLVGNIHSLLFPIPVSMLIQMTIVCSMILVAILEIYMMKKPNVEDLVAKGVCLFGVYGICWGVIGVLNLTHIQIPALFLVASCLVFNLLVIGITWCIGEGKSSGADQVAKIDGKSLTPKDLNMATSSNVCSYDNPPPNNHKNTNKSGDSNNTSVEEANSQTNQEIRPE